MTIQTVKNSATDAKRLQIEDSEYYRYTGADALEDGEGDGIFIGKMKSFAIKADCKLSYDEIQSAVKILSYFWKTTIKGNESLTEWVSIDDEIILFKQGLFDDSANSSLSRSGHPSYRFAQLVLELNKKMSEGTTPRKHGTRLEKGITRFQNGVNSLISFSVWVDEVQQKKDVTIEPPVVAAPAVAPVAAPQQKAVAPSDIIFGAVPRPQPITPVKEEATEPAWDIDPDDFMNKDAGDLTFNEVRELLKALKVSHKRATKAEEENAELREKLEAIRSLTF
jgi:hypothetical protein